jgi:hypothetical protein
MKETVAKRINELIGKMTCPKDFSCVESGFALLCKAKNFGDRRFLECLDPDPKNCVFSLTFENSKYCQCPLRRYIKMNLHE